MRLRLCFSSSNEDMQASVLGFRPDEALDEGHRAGPAHDDAAVRVVAYRGVPLDGVEGPGRLVGPALEDPDVVRGVRARVRPVAVPVVEDDVAPLDLALREDPQAVLAGAGVRDAV